MRPRLLVLAALLALPRPAWALREWYESYLDARDKHIPAGRYADCLTALKEAVKLKSEPGLQVQTYGLQFIDYFPYYYMGICYQGQGELQNAITLFNMEEQKGLIKRSEKHHKDLFQRTSDAKAALDAGERKRAVDRARTDVEAALREADALEKARRFEEALVKLKGAESLARILDARTQRTIAEAGERIKKEQQETADATTRTQRIEQGLSEGARLLEEGNGNEASTRFAAVLAVDPQNAKALEGKKRSDALILATTTRLVREGDLQKGKTLLEAGQYAEAIASLTNAAVDIPEAAELLKRAQQMGEGLKKLRETQIEIDRLYKQGEAFVAAGRYDQAWVSFEGVLRLDPEHA